MNVGKLSFQNFFPEKALETKNNKTYIKNLFPSWLNRSEAHVMLFCGKTCPWHCGKKRLSEYTWTFMSHKNTKTSDLLFLVTLRMKVRNHISVKYFYALNERCNQMVFQIPHYNNVNAFVRQVISFEMFVYYQYILQRFWCESYIAAQAGKIILSTFQF